MCLPDLKIQIKFVVHRFLCEGDKTHLLKETLEQKIWEALSTFLFEFYT